MNANTRKLLLVLGYGLALAWIIPAVTYSVYQAIEQEDIFSFLRTIRYDKDQAAIDKASAGLNKFGLEGLIYIIQELKQDEARDKRIKVANVLKRFIAADSDRKRWGWGERNALQCLLEHWPETPGIGMEAFDPAAIRRLLTKKPTALAPEDRRQVLRFAIEYAFVAMDWKVEDGLEVFRNRAERLKFQTFLDLVRAEQLKFRPPWSDSKPEVELNGDQMKRAEDFVDDWIEKEAEKKEKCAFSPEAVMAGKLEGFLAGDPVTFSPEECDKMIAVLDEWRAKWEELTPQRLPQVYDVLKEKLRRFADGVPVSFRSEDVKDVCTKLDTFKDDYISYAVEVKFEKTTERYFRTFADKGMAPFDVAPEEADVALNVARKCRREYAYARVQMARTARQIVRDLTARRKCFQILVQDIDHKQSVLRQLTQAWKAKNDEIVMLDLIDLLQDEDFGVRVNISDALVAIGQPAVYYLVEQMKKVRVSSTAVVPTRDKTRSEREKELNAKNTQARREVAMVLGRIGSEKAKEELKRMTKDPVIGATVHEALARLRAQKGSK